MASDTMARQATGQLVLEALERWGPMPSRWLEETLDETPRSINHALSGLLARQRVGLVRTADCLVVQYEARRA